MSDPSPPADLPPAAPASGGVVAREDLLRVFLAQRERMEALVSRRVGCRATAADLVQDLFLRFWRRPAAPVEDLATYLLRSAHNLAIDHMRSEGARTRNEAGLALEQDEAPPPEVALEAGHDLRHVDAALRSLPERTRHIFLLNRIHGSTYGDIARAMGLSLSAVEKHMMRALEACKASLLDRPAVISPGSAKP
ncbi:DNA-directed RNA polymerase sigma-70 factor [Pseudomonas tohonis]|uniref:DNA-directed RNA polymerase sigma-70 factor n=1 Tax=Pseudomonas tohonis TaxID=2725477 RepID=A0A6J4EGW6_9PSED|nr:RNA polymerase sigma factor [Pseudomonas tohonis]BCG27711.1 DNA-directed RNA polymerase sigma-70 factor [Pseudomonas tohonis]GJN54158.1 DNA-directed RNA polymerase sigma-70 factor [Pseudomonas tohonis]